MDLNEDYLRLLRKFTVNIHFQIFGGKIERSGTVFSG